MNRFVSVAVVGVLGTACGDGQDQKPDTIDPVALTIQTGVPATLVALRDEASATWQTIDVAGRATFDVNTTGPYRLVVVCASGQSVSAIEAARTPEDDALFTYECGQTNFPFQLSGAMAEPGAVQLSNNRESSGLTLWSFMLPAGDQPADLTMLFGDVAEPDRIAIRRGVSAAAAPDLGTLSATQEHAEMLVPVSFRVSNATPGEPMRQSTRLELAHDTVVLRNADLDTSASSWDTAVAPATMVQPGERQTIAVSSEISSTRHFEYRVVSREVRNDTSVELALPSFLGQVNFAMTPRRLVTTLPPVGESTLVRLWRNSIDTSVNHGWDHALELTSRFVAATGTTSVALDFTEIPGFLAEWHASSTSEVSRGLSFRATSAGNDYTLVEFGDTIMPTSPAR